MAPEYSDPIFEQSLEALKSQAMNFGLRFIPDAKVRSEYIAQAQKFSQELTDQVRSGRMTPREGGQIAQTLRNTLMEHMRLKSSDIGRAYAEGQKLTGKTFPDLENHYALKKFQNSFSSLTPAQKNQVWLEIVSRSGRPNPRVNQIVRRMGKAGRGLVILSLAVSVYNVATSEDKPREAAHEVTVLGGGIVGSAAAGAVSGLACGPGAPVCVTLGVFVGGVLGALGAEWAFQLF